MGKTKRQETKRLRKQGLLAAVPSSLTAASAKSLNERRRELVAASARAVVKRAEPRKPPAGADTSKPDAMEAFESVATELLAIPVPSRKPSRPQPAAELPPAAPALEVDEDGDIAIDAPPSLGVHKKHKTGRKQAKRGDARKRNRKVKLKQARARSRKR